MKLLFDLFPLILFFAAFKFYGIFVATGVAIVAAIGQISWLKMSNRRIEVMHWITFGAIVVLGGATLISQDENFIRWKPTVVYWLFSLLLFGSHFVGKKTAIEYVMGSQLKLPRNIWNKMNFSFGLFTLTMGLLNLYVAFVYGSDLNPDVQREHWVNFKVFGTLILTFAFILIVMLFVSRHIDVDQASTVNEKNE